jgi:hypothetical protein
MRAASPASQFMFRCISYIVLTPRAVDFPPQAEVGSFSEKIIFLKSRIYSQLKVCRASAGNYPQDSFQTGLTVAPHRV